MRFAGLAGWLLCGLALLTGCAAPRDTGPMITRPVLHRRMTGPQEHKLIIDGYRKEKGCHGPGYAAARRYAAKWLDSVVSVPTEPRRLADAIENARFRIRLAQMATSKRCFDVARDAYVEVNEIFTGEPYEKLRQQADLGLNTLQSRTSPRRSMANEVH